MVPNELQNAQDLAICLDRCLRLHHSVLMENISVHAEHGDEEYWRIAFRQGDDGPVITMIDIEHEKLDVDCGKTMFREVHWEPIRNSSIRIIQGFLAGRGKM